MDTQRDLEEARLADRIRELLAQERIGAAQDVALQLQDRDVKDPFLREMKRILAPTRVTVSSYSGRANVHEEIAWIESHAEEYRGLWVALVGSRLLAAAPDLASLDERLAGSPSKEPPFIYKIPKA